MEILNHLEDLSDYGIEYTEDDRRIFIEFEDELSKNFTIKYMKSPVDMTLDGVMSAVSRRFDKEVFSGKEMYDNLIPYLIEDKKYKSIFNDTIYIYKIGKLFCLNANDEKYSIYTIRIGTDFKFD